MVHFKDRGKIYNVLSNYMQVSKAEMLLPNVFLQGGIWMGFLEHHAKYGKIIL